MNAIAEAKIGYFIFQFFAHCPFAHEDKVTVLHLFLDQACNVDEYIRSFFGRKTPYKPDEGSFWRKIEDGMEVIRLGGGVENLGIHSVCDEAQFACRNAEAQGVKIGGFCNDTDVSLRYFMDFQITQAEIAAMNRSQRGSLSKFTQDARKQMSIGKMRVDDIDRLRADHAY